MENRMSTEHQLTNERHIELRRLAIELRRLVVQSVHHAGAGHLGGPMSAAEILTALYFEILNIHTDEPQHPDRDRFIMSKGHSSIGLYAVLALRGYFPIQELRTFDEINSRLQGHPDMSVLDALDMSTGSLGQGLSPGVGMALAARLNGRNYHTWVLIGDGDSQEGQIWEAAFIAERYQLNNLTAILDWNGLQQYGWATDEGYSVIPRKPAQENPKDKWEAFGWTTVEIDGHDFHQILDACTWAKNQSDPSLIIARTVKGKGISYMENDFSWHSKPVTDDDLKVAQEELAAQEAVLKT